MAKPTPGSSEAIALGCKCPPKDNHHGAGIMLGGELCFWKSQGCPLHEVDSLAVNSFLYGGFGLGVIQSIDYEKDSCTIWWITGDFTTGPITYYADALRHRKVTVTAQRLKQLNYLACPKWLANALEIVEGGFSKTKPITLAL